MATHKHGKLLVAALAISLLMILSGTAAAVEDTQTPSQEMGAGAKEVIKSELEEINGEEVTELSEQADSLIEEGVPPGILVSVVKSVGTGHLSADEIGSVFSDLQNNIVDGEKSPGLVIKSVKTAYELPDVDSGSEAQLQSKTRKKDQEGDNDRERDRNREKKRDQKEPEEEDENKSKGSDQNKGQGQEKEDDDKKGQSGKDNSKNSENKGNEGEENGNQGQQHGGEPEGQGNGGNSSENGNKGDGDNPQKNKKKGNKKGGKKGKPENPGKGGK